VGRATASPTRRARKPRRHREIEVAFLPEPSVMTPSHPSPVWTKSSDLPQNAPNPDRAHLLFLDTEIARHRLVSAMCL